MPQRMIPAELRAPPPRRTRARAFFKLLLVFPVLIYIPIAFLVVKNTYPAIHKMEILKERGLDADAMITARAIVLRHAGKVRDYYITYGFHPQPPNASLQFNATDGTNANTYRRLKLDQTIPIIYDPTAPGVSALNFNNSVRRNNPYLVLCVDCAVAFLPFAVIYIILISKLVWTYYCEKALLRSGRASAAE